MSSGFVYILKNHSFHNYLVKIGKSIHEPQRRGQELYHGATGIPEPFEIVAIFHSKDIGRAERRIHQKLTNYRHNPRREYFFIHPRIALEIASFECNAVNAELGDVSAALLWTSIFDEKELIDYDESNLTNILVDQIKPRNVAVRRVTQNEVERAEIIFEILGKYMPFSLKEMMDGLSRDTTVGREVSIWEKIAKAFMKAEATEMLNENQKQEAFEILLLRSMATNSRILEEFDFKYLSRNVAKTVLRGYEGPPEPLVVEMK